jgi:hypothetical protein
LAEDEIPIGALSRRTGCNIETIRYYERIGVLPHPRRNGRYRSYRPNGLSSLMRWRSSVRMMGNLSTSPRPRCGVLDFCGGGLALAEWPLFIWRIVTIPRRVNAPHKPAFHVPRVALPIFACESR